MDRERSDTYNRVVVDIAAKLLPVLDNLKRALGDRGVCRGERI